MRILIGFNGSEAAMAALQDLRYAGLPDNSEILLLTVVESWLPPRTAADAEIASLEGRIITSEAFPNLKVTAMTTSGSPDCEILACAESFKPDLIVVGEPHKTPGEQNMCIGHTSNTILTEAACSVRIVRGHRSVRSNAERILVGFDGSVGAPHAVDSIARRKWHSETKVRLLAVADSSVLGSIGRFTPQMNDAVVEAKFVSQWAETLAAASLEKLRRVGLSSSVEVQFGHPKDVIVEEAERWNADMIFVGPHSEPNSLERFLIGSVSVAVAAWASCSVEIVRKSTERAHRYIVGQP